MHLFTDCWLNFVAHSEECRALWQLLRDNLSALAGRRDDDYATRCCCLRREWWLWTEEPALNLHVTPITMEFCLDREHGGPYFNFRDMIVAGEETRRVLEVS